MGKLPRTTINHQVKCKRPGTTEYTEGCVVIDQVWAKAPQKFSSLAPHNHGWGENAFLVQLIKWYEEKRVRFTYYHRPSRGNSRSWRFGGQFAAMMSLKEFHSIFRDLNKKRW
jgi:hypothetical protein